MIKNIFVVLLVISLNIVCFANENIAVKDVSMQSSNGAQKRVEALYGSWKIVDYKWSGMFSGEEKNPQRHIGIVLFFGSDRAQLINVSDVLCKAPKYRFHKEANADKYLFNNYRARSMELGIKTTGLNVIEIKCKDQNNLPTEYWSEIFVIGKNKAILVTEGPFYYLQKVKNNDTETVD